jgi:protein FAM32A
MKPVFVGGSLSFKGDKKAKKKKAKSAKHVLDTKAPPPPPPSSSTDDLGNIAGGEAAASCAYVGENSDKSSSSISAAKFLLEADLTDAEKKALRKRKEREAQELADLAKKSHRERVEEFNEKLASLTEHNDIPRVRSVVVLVCSCSCPSRLAFAFHDGFNVRCFVRSSTHVASFCRCSRSEFSGQCSGEWLRTGRVLAAPCQFVSLWRSSGGVLNGAKLREGVTGVS